MAKWRAALARPGSAQGVEVVAVGRPGFDLERPSGIDDALAAERPDIIVSAAAYTAVDKAEAEPEAAFAANRDGAGAVAAAAQRLGVPVIHLSTDYVFDGTKASPYVETDPVNPLSVYGRSKLEGERLVGAVADHVILRTAWVYSTHGRNFVKTMKALGADRDRVRVVADQIGAPTSAHDIADAIIAIAARLKTSQAAELRGIFHLSGTGEASWADFAEAIFADLAERGRPSVAVDRIATRDYPVAARRPPNSRLDCSRLLAVHGLGLPHWRSSLRACLDRLAADAGAPQNGA